MNYWPALALGFLGSMHCALMCSPLMLSVRWGGTTGLASLRNKLIYQVGRIASYVGIGLLFYSVGSQLNLATFQKAASITIGGLLVAMAFYSFGKFNYFNILITRVYQKLHRWFSPITNKKNWVSKLTLGALNGLLPCGLVYIAALTSILETSASHVMAYMTVFGLGTSPIIIAILYGSGAFKSRRLFSNKHLRPVLFVLIGTAFILRGMELGIPYVSPILDVVNADSTAICE